ncbi:AAA family ATPase [Streptomyces inhibens]|uniref:AAA family ATPase n=1 Tax=Streptomyces inhibens TaxID=2293571 RepID=UPI001EE763D2|nr:ATP-binding protein [Streptomyces inhibens]UKY50307.1 ATP-binding protein [Streptomyces inhibens]
MLVQRMARRYRRTNVALSEELRDLLRAAPSLDSPMRDHGNATPVPLDGDSRLPLIRTDQLGPAVTPVLVPAVKAQVEQLRDEHQNLERLAKSGLTPSRTGLFTGPPGVGKTLAARWLAGELKRPLMVLDLSSVMSSYLGRTGSNIRKVLDYAKSSPSVLLLDELDTVAKRRDDVAEVGELKRLVTVLLQEIDDWPSSSLLLAATNHGDLLDPAVWRRFDLVVDFPLPGPKGLEQALAQYCGPVSREVVQFLVHSLAGASFADAERLVMAARRRAALSDEPLFDVLLKLGQDRLRDMGYADRLHIALDLVQHGGISQRRVSELTGISRDTIRRRQRDE